MNPTFPPLNNNPDPVDSVGYRAWDAFYTRMEQQLKRPCGRNQYWQNKYYKAFRRIAELCIAHQIDVTDFIVVNFKTIAKNHKYVLPTDFADARGLERYKQYKNTNKGDSTKGIWATQIELLVSLLTTLVPQVYPDEESILMNSSLPFTAWFRILYPENISDTLLNAYGQAAWLELKENSELRAFAFRHARKNFTVLEQTYGRFGDYLLENI